MNLREAKQELREHGYILEKKEQLDDWSRFFDYEIIPLLFFPSIASFQHRCTKIAKNLSCKKLYFMRIIILAITTLLAQAINCIANTFMYDNDLTSTT